MHFIVTGGAGFIGSHLTEQLLSEGHDVTVVDNLTTGNTTNLPQHPHLKLLTKSILDCQPEDFTVSIDAIAHLAATPSVAESWLKPLETHHNNLSVMIAIIQLCQTLNIPRLVFASSAAVYGNTNQLPILEAHHTIPMSPYGLQKLVSEQYANLFAQESGLSFIALRLFNVFGPRQVLNSPYSGVISIFTKAIQQGLPITIYGDGTQTRDFVYVKDVAVAFTKALTTTLPAGSCITCNVGTGKRTSLLQIVQFLKAYFPETKVEINFKNARLGDIKHSQADVSKIASIFNFYPQLSVESALSLFIESLPVSLVIDSQKNFTSLAS
jgi:UDP-glucose 4-epimerase